MIVAWAHASAAALILFIRAFHVLSVATAIIKQRQEVSAANSGFSGGLEAVPHAKFGDSSACVKAGGAWRPSPSEARVETTMRFFKRLRFKLKVGCVWESVCELAGG